MFKLESEMIPIIRGSLPQLLNFSCIACANELPVNSRIVDIAATPVNTDHFKSTLNLTKALSKLNLLQLNLLATLIDNSPASIHRLINETYLNNNDLHDLLLDPCLKMGFSKFGGKKPPPHNGTVYHPHYVEFHRTEKVCCPARLLSHNDHYRILVRSLNRNFSVW
jgi:hypothetical protein